METRAKTDAAAASKLKRVRTLKRRDRPRFYPMDDPNESYTRMLAEGIRHARSSNKPPNFGAVDEKFRDWMRTNHLLAPGERAVAADAIIRSESMNTPDEVARQAIGNEFSKRQKAILDEDPNYSRHTPVRHYRREARAAIWSDRKWEEFEVKDPQIAQNLAELGFTAEQIEQAIQDASPAVPGMSDGGQTYARQVLATLQPNDTTTHRADSDDERSDRPNRERPRG